LLRFAFGTARVTFRTRHRFTFTVHSRSGFIPTTLPAVHWFAPHGSPDIAVYYTAHTPHRLLRGCRLCALPPPRILAHCVCVPARFFTGSGCTIYCGSPSTTLCRLYCDTRHTDHLLVVPVLRWFVRTPRCCVTTRLVYAFCTLRNTTTRFTFCYAVTLGPFTTHVPHVWFAVYCGS